MPRQSRQARWHFVKKINEYRKSPFQVLHLKWVCDTCVIHVFLIFGVRPVNLGRLGFQSEVKLHKTPTKKDIANGYRENELIALFDLPAHWLMNQMNSYCVGANYVFLDGKHYYTVHHA